MARKADPSGDAPETDVPSPARGRVERTARRPALKGGAALAVAMVLRQEVDAQEAEGGDGLDPLVTNDLAAAAVEYKVTVTLQKMDISVQPIGRKTRMTLTIRKDSSRKIKLTIPELKMNFRSSKESRNFAPATREQPFPTLIIRPSSGASSGPDTSTYSYPPLPEDYPLGGFVDTVNNPIPDGLRPTSALPVKFVVRSKAIPNRKYQGVIDNQGRLQFSAPDDYPLGVGQFETTRTVVYYKIGKHPKVPIENLAISPGFSNAAKWNPLNKKMFSDPRPIKFDFGDYDDPQKGFLNGIYYPTWADNSSALHYNSNNQAYKSYALAKINVRDFGRSTRTERLVNLSREPGGERLDQKFTYAEGGAAVDPTNELNLVVVYQQRRSDVNGFVISRSFDGGNSWTRKLIATHVPGKKNEPSDPNIPLGSSDIHAAFDRFGGLWISYLHGKLTNTSAGFFGGPVPLIYSDDKGETFHHVLNQNALKESGLPPEIVPVYIGLDYTYLAVGPDATNLDYDTVWMSIADAIDGNAPNDFQQRVWGLRVKGLGVSRIDLRSLKKYVVPSSRQAGYASMAVGPRGEVVISLRQVNLKDTFLEQLQNNNRYWINVLKRGLAGNRFSDKREYALLAIGSSSTFPPTPHNNYVGTGTAMIAIDRSKQHPGRIYAIYCNRPGIYSFASKPFFSWSDDQGLTWSDPINVSTDKSPATATRPGIAIDPRSGVVALSWYDARDSKDNTEMRHYATFLDPRQLR